MSRICFARLYDRNLETVAIGKHQVMQWLKTLALMDDEAFAMEDWSPQDRATALRLARRLGCIPSPQEEVTSGR